MKGRKNKRVDTRSNVFLSAVLEIGSQIIPVRIRNISSRGALIDGQNIPCAGVSVLLVRGSLSAPGHVAWRQQNQAGISFDEAVEASVWVGKAGHLRQQRVDDIVAAIKRSDPLPRTSELEDEPSLSELSGALEKICQRLGDIPAITDEFGEELVRLDAIAQTLRRISSRGRA